MKTGFQRFQRNALALVLALALGGSASAARAQAGGCELLGFPSEDAGGHAVPPPPCATTPIEAHASLLAGMEAPTPPPVPTPATRARAAARADRVRAARAPHAPVVAVRRTLTDTTIAVTPGMKFSLNNFGGAISIRTWARNAVHVRADHARKDRIVIGKDRGSLNVISSSRTGAARSVSYDLTVPAWLPITLSGVYNDVNVDGLMGGIDVETVRGDIVVRRAGGVIGLRSVEGVVDLVGARGTIRVSSVNEAVRVANVIGTIAAEGVNGDIHLIDVNSKDVEATTVNGDVVYDGRILDGGSYRFATHSGDIALGLSDKANATVGVSTFSGDFGSAFAIRPRRTDKGRRFTFALGNGSAKIDLESFQGSIELFRPGGKDLRWHVVEAWKEHEREWNKEWKWDMKQARAPHDDDE